MRLAEPEMEPTPDQAYGLRMYTHRLAEPEMEPTPDVPFLICLLFSRLAEPEMEPTPDVRRVPVMRAVQVS